MKKIGAFLCAATIGAATLKMGYTFFDWQWVAWCAPVWLGIGLIEADK